ncbi:MAG TPA: type IV secretion protein Rhs, partial [Porphyromonadaceae bacterium]|nr:type IV secretion protein Rhs [Porphyromonadaceae bacterium]
MKWKAGAETTERGYQFAYDGLNRMASAYYGEGYSLTANPNRYNELPTYDKMGNIKTLQRQGKQDSGYGLIDNLTYAYTGNQLTKVTDAVNGPLYNGAFHFMDGANVATEYVYDKNGNLIKDYNKKIVDIQYNALNLPDALQFTNDNTTSYMYDAAGSKLSVTHQTAVAGVTIPMTSVMTPLATTNILATT